MTAGWLVDRSAIRPTVAAFMEVLVPAAAAGRVGICVVTELELGYSARSAADWEGVRRNLLPDLRPVLIPPRAEQRAREVQAELIRRGQHRAVGVPDLIVAAVAEVEDLTVMHYDGDFDLIADVTEQPVEWIVPVGSI